MKLLFLCVCSPAGYSVFALYSSPRQTHTSDSSAANLAHMCEKKIVQLRCMLLKWHISHSEMCKLLLCKR